MKPVVAVALIGAGSVMAAMGMLGLVFMLMDPATANPSNPTEQAAPWYFFVVLIATGLALGVFGARLFAKSRRNKAEPEPKP